MKKKLCMGCGEFFQVDPRRPRATACVTEGCVARAAAVQVEAEAHAEEMKEVYEPVIKGIESIINADAEIMARHRGGGRRRPRATTTLPPLTFQRIETQPNPIPGPRGNQAVIGGFRGLEWTTADMETAQLTTDRLRRLAVQLRERGITPRAPAPEPEGFDE